MLDALAGLRAAVREMLAAAGERRLAAIVDRAGLEVAGPAERWEMGSRAVEAVRLALVVEPAVHVELTAEPARLLEVREAFAKVVRTPETELAGLSLVVRLPGIERGWHHAYRVAPPPAAPDRPEPEAVLGGAAALLAAKHQREAAAMLARGHLESAEVPTSGPQLLIRYVLRLDPVDRRAVEYDPALADRLREAVRDAGASAAASVADVVFATALRPPPAPDDAEARLTRALIARGAVVVPVRRDDHGFELVVVAGSHIRRLEVKTHGTYRQRDVDYRAESIAVVVVHREQLDDPTQFASIVTGIHGGGPPGDPDLP